MLVCYSILFIELKNVYKLKETFSSSDVYGTLEVSLFLFSEIRIM